MTSYYASLPGVPPFMEAPDQPPLPCRAADVDPDWFFHDPDLPPGVQELFAERAKAVCGRCPYKDPCLAWAVETRQDTATWGGRTERERRKDRDRRTKAGRATA